MAFVSNACSGRTGPDEINALARKTVAAKTGRGSIGASITVGNQLLLERTATPTEIDELL